MFSPFFPFTTKQKTPRIGGLPFIFIVFFTLISCSQERPASAPPHSTSQKSSSSDIPESKAVLRVSATNQKYNFLRPWLKKAPYSRNAIGVVLKNNLVLVTAEVISDHNYVELEKGENGSKTQAEVISVDYEANLALLKPKDKAFLEDRTPVELILDSKVGTPLYVLQFEDNGQVAQTQGHVTTVEVAPYPLEALSLLVYRMNVSIQQRKNSFSLPVIRDGKLAGFIMRYQRNSQTATILPAPIIHHFLEDSKNLPYKGFPKLGINFSKLQDPQLIRYSGLPDGETGVFLTHVLPKSPAEKAGLKKGDILSKIGEFSIDSDGNYNDPLYGRVQFSHLISGKGYHGEKWNLEYIRQGKKENTEATLERKDPQNSVIPPYLIDQQPEYLIIGGLVFLELSRPYLQQWGSTWSSKAPQQFVYYERFQTELFKDITEPKRIVFLSHVLRTKSNIGFEKLSHLELLKMNNQPINDLTQLRDALKNPIEGFHKIEFNDDPHEIYLDAALIQSEEELLQKAYRIPKLQYVK